MKRLATAVIVTTALVSAGTVLIHPGNTSPVSRFEGLEASSFDAKGTYAIDPVHAGISFEVRHLGLTNVHGRIAKFSGTLETDFDDLTKASVDFKAETAAIDTAIPARDQHLRQPDYFDAEKYPEIRFKSTKVEKVGNSYAVTGDLTIRDKTNPVTIRFKKFGPFKSEVRERKNRIGFDAEPVVIKRSDFGVGPQAKLPTGELALGDEVTVRISFEATQDLP